MCYLSAKDGWRLQHAFRQFREPSRNGREWRKWNYQMSTETTEISVTETMLDDTFSLEQCSDVDLFFIATMKPRYIAMFQTWQILAV